MPNARVRAKMAMFETYLQRSHLERKSYQFEGVEWCLENEMGGLFHGGIIADEMGLGKTIQVIGLMCCHFVGNTLIIVPPILIPQWSAQLEKTSGHTPLIYHGTATKKRITAEQLARSPVVISSYGEIIRLGSLLFRVKWGRVVFDEAHHLRNGKTSRHRGAMRLKSPIKWLVSGTPIQNKRSDFYALCNIVRIPSQIYQDVDALKHYAPRFILKRTKAQLGIRIADLLIHTIRVNWFSREERMFAKAVHAQLRLSNTSAGRGNPYINDALKLKGHSVMVRILRARQVCIYPKLTERALAMDANPHANATISAVPTSSKINEVVKHILARKDNGNGKLVFCDFRDEIYDLFEMLVLGGLNSAEISILDGVATKESRMLTMTVPYKVVILQIQTGCEGLNLQEHYSEVYFITNHWNPFVEEQAIARCHRIGQRKPVQVFRFEMSDIVVDDDLPNDRDADADTDTDTDTDEEPKSSLPPITIEQHIQKNQMKKLALAEEIIKCATLNH